MRVLITNDDGIDSPGIHALAAVTASLGHDVIVAAPAWNSSGASASLTGVTEEGHLLVERRTLDAAPDVTAFAVESAPAMIVRVGVRGGFGPAPDLVLSGINDGPNTGHAVLHSGTVGAALTAATHGCRSVAFSLGVGEIRHFEEAAQVAREVIQWAEEEPAPLALNVNVPSLPASEQRGLRFAPLAAFGAVQTNVTEKSAGYLRVSFAEIDPDDDDLTDASLLAQGWTTATPLSPVCEADTDLTSLVDERRPRWITTP